MFQRLCFSRVGTFGLMMLMMLILMLGVGTVDSSARGDDWSHWRGPTGNGASTDAKPPVSWSATENVRSKTLIPGRGSGSPVVTGDRVFVTTAVGDPTGRSELDFRVLCIERRTGKVLWDRSVIRATPHEGTHSTNTFASASPCTDGKFVYASFGSRGVFCLTVDGDVVWSRTDLGQMQTRATFGEGASPTLFGDVLLVPLDHEGPSKLYCLDAADGRDRWVVRRDEPTNWGTPLVVPGPSDDGGNDSHQVVMTGQTKVRSYDLKTGRELWSCGGQTMRPVASPVFADGIVYVGSGFRGAFLGAFRLSGRGDIEGTDAVVWTRDRDTPDIASLLLSDGRLYFHKAKTGLITCVNAADGRTLFGPERLPEIRTTYASPIAAGGHVYATGRGGVTVVIDDAATYRVVAVNSIGEGVDATPAAVDNELWIRGETHLFCVSAN